MNGDLIPSVKPHTSDVMWGQNEEEIGAPCFVIGEID